VYRITNTIAKKHYYGKRSSKILPLLDIGIRYFSSSRDKEFLKEQKTFPERFKYKVVKLCTSSQEAIAYEILLHSKFDVAKNPKFYNRSKQTSTGWDTTGIKGVSSCNKNKIVAKTADGTIIRVSVNDPRYTNGELVHHLKGCKLNKQARKNISNGHKGHRNAKARPVNIYNYYTDALIAENVILNDWCKGTKYHSQHLYKTLKRNIEKPHCSNSSYKDRINVLHHKGIYAKDV
jgi:hypothetical protein